MFGYHRWLAIRQLNTSALLLNAAIPASSSANRMGDRPHRRVLSNADRTRANGANRRSTDIDKKFREIQQERQLLVERHRDAIESAELTDLPSLVEMIEFGSSSCHNYLEHVLKLIKTPDNLKNLNDRQLSVLILAGGGMNSDSSLKFRQKYIEKLWEAASKSHAELGLQSYNSLIQVNIENQVSQNAVEILQKFDEAGIEADENTFALLSKVYALEGQTVGILQIIEILKEQNIPATQPLFESLVYSLAYNNDEAQLKNTLKSLAVNPRIDVVGLYISAAMAKARTTKNIDEVLKVFVDIPVSIRFEKKENHQKVFEIAMYLLENGATGVIEKLKDYLWMDQNMRAIRDSSFAEKEALRLFQNGHQNAALELFGFLFDDSKSRLRTYFNDLIIKSVKTSTPNDVAEIAELFRNAKIFSKPLSRAVLYAYQEKLPIFPIYEKFITSEEFKDYEDRYHLFYPLLMDLCSKIDALKPGDPKRSELLSKLLDIYDPFRTPNSISNNVDKLICAEVEDEDRLKKLLSVEKKHSYLITTIIVGRMLDTNQLEKLEALINAPLANEHVKIIRVLPSIIKALQYPDLSESNISVIAKVIIAGFADDSRALSATSQDFSFRALHDIYVNSSIPDQRLTSLTRYLSNDPKVGLSHDEITGITKDIPARNRSVRSELLKQLRKKSKAVIRWSQSSVEELEKEAAYLIESEAKSEIVGKIYQIILQKLADDKQTSNGRKMLEVIRKANDLDLKKSEMDYNHAIKVAFKRCLMDSDLEGAKELWNMKKDHFKELNLLYSLCLIDNGEFEEAKKPLEEFKRPPDDTTLLKAIKYKAVNLQSIEKFIELLTTTFSFGSLTHRRLTTEIKKMELRKAIADDDLEKAFEVANNFSKLNHSAFGQNDLMAACISKGNKALLSQVFDMVASRHDRNTASIDLLVAFLECGSFPQAEMVFKKANGLYMNSGKMEFLRHRQADLKKPDVLHNIFLLFHHAESSAAVDLELIMKKCMDLYYEQGNLAGLKHLQADIENLKFKLEKKTQAHLESLISQLSSKKDTELRASRARSMSSGNPSLQRNDSVFEAPEDIDKTETAV